MTCETCLNGDLTTITFSDSGFTAPFVRIGGPTISREIVDASILDGTTCANKCPGDVIDYGELPLEWCKDPDENPPYDQPTEEVIITYPPKVGQTTGATLTFQAFLREWKIADAVKKERMVDSGVLVIACDPDPVWTPGS